MNARFHLGPLALAWLAAVLAACSGTPHRSTEKDACELSAFSGARPGNAWPEGWQGWSLSQYKKPTRYRLVEQDGATVLEAEADRSASGLVFKLDVAASACHELAWRWKVGRAIDGADPERANADDAPARVIVTFSGDRKRFTFDDRLFAAKIKAFTGQELPYATLIYAWNRKHPAGSVVLSPHTQRIRTLTLGEGREISAWTEVHRNLVADYRLAFGEEPGRIASVALMTDADNTGKQALAWYGDIVLQGDADGR